MNAKKIMGAVLVALLAAALFVGAGAAALTEGDQGTYFIYQEDLNPELDGTWTNGAASVVIDGGVIYPVGDFVAGTYTKGKYTMTILLPTVNYKLEAEYGTTAYLVTNGGTIYNGSNVTVTITSLNTDVKFTNVLATIPGQGTKNVTFTSTQFDVGKKVEKTGTYKFQVIFNGTGLVEGTPANLLLDANIFTFKVVNADEATISGSVDTVYSGEYVTFTVAGTPGEKYSVNTTGFDKISTQQLIEFTDATTNQTFTMPNTGKATFSAKVNTSEKEAVVKLIYTKDGTFIKDAEVKIKVSAPVVTATLTEPGYYIGEEIKITGTSTAGAPFTFTISGTNYNETTITDADFVKGKKWTANLTVPGKPDVGTYTIKVKQGKEVVATLAVALKQPFISIASAPEIIGQDKAATFLINAEAAKGVQAYFFGTNYFHTANAVAEEDKDGKAIANLFNVTLTKDDTNKSKMATGQYFAVFQHPMYDTVFNIGAEETGAVFQNNNGEWNVTADAKEIFNATDRQTANAAQALCDALDSQLIDDMYVKYSFFVVKDLEKDTFSMSEIPAEVTKGTKIVISGVDTANKNGVVTVEMISTAFAAIPKENVGSAAFILATAKIAEDGTWEVTLDTSDLNVDEYSVSVAIEGLTKESVTVNVIEGAPVTPTDEPTVVPTDAPVTPTDAPKTPGFGALAALAGLGAVAVLLLRRE